MPSGSAHLPEERSDRRMCLSETFDPFAGSNADIQAAHLDCHTPTIYIRRTNGLTLRRNGAPSEVDRAANV